MKQPFGYRRAGFTVIELMVVVGIIGILIGISFAVGRGVVTGAKQRSTEDVLQLLDASLQAYLDAKDGQHPPLYVVDPIDNNKVWPMVDARDMSNAAGANVTPPGNAMVNSLGWYWIEAQKVPAAKAILDKIPSRLIARVDIDGVGNNQPELTVVLDAWGKPIRFVHPAFDGRRIAGNTPASATGTDAPLPAGKTPGVTDLRRNHESTAFPLANAQNFPDSDGASCSGGRGYFYSLGEDGFAGWYRSAGPPEPFRDGTADNIYSTPPVRRGSPG
jgi:prepilin-type N-terminal cleavage/methylation domain-containing protein